MELSKKHPEIEKTKIRLWARMISGGLHDDYEKPPRHSCISSSSEAT